MGKDIILEKSDNRAVAVYELSKKLPKEELYGFTSQLRRAALSVPLNIVEGFARYKSQDHRRFLEISYGSLKETIYLLTFGVKIKYFTEFEVSQLVNDYTETSRMLWSKIQTLKNKK
jgi:four helix bundle protein